MTSKTKTKKPTAHKLDIFKVLSQLNSNDLEVYKNFSEEEKKGFSPYIISQWMFGTDDPVQVLYLNTLVNPFIWDLGKHPELLCKLLAVCGTGSYKRFKWIPLSKKSKSDALRLKVIMDYYGYSEREAQSNLCLLSNEDVIELAHECGYQKEEIKKLMQELK